MDGDSVRFFTIVPATIIASIIFVFFVDSGVYNFIIDAIYVGSTIFLVFFLTKQFLEAHKQYYMDGHYEYIFHIFRKPKHVPMEILEDDVDELIEDEK